MSTLGTVKEIGISNNAVLTSLAGLDNVDPAQLTNVTLLNSNTLSFCAVKSICNYLEIPNNPATISGNASACNDRAEVLNSCLIPTGNLLSAAIKIYPNPTTGLLTIEGLEMVEATLEITNNLGQVIFKDIITANQIDLSKLSEGLYFISIQYNEQRLVYRIIKTF